MTATPPARMPSEEDVARFLCKKEGYNLDLDPDLWREWIEPARDLLALFAPLLAEKEREIAATHDAYQQAAVDTVALLREVEARALAAEAALAGAPTVETLRAAMIESGFLYEHAGKLHTGIRGDEVVESDFANLVKLLGLPHA